MPTVVYFFQSWACFNRQNCDLSGLFWDVCDQGDQRTNQFSTCQLMNEKMNKTHDVEPIILLKIFSLKIQLYMLV